jgi:hypothetical protein
MLEVRMPTVPEHFKRLPWFRTTASQPPSPGFTPVSNGIVSSMLTAEDRAALRVMNHKLTREAIAQAEAWTGVRNQIEFGTQIANALSAFEAHGVPDALLVEMSHGHDIVFPWSLQYGNLRQPFNQRLVRLPLAIVFPHTAAEVSDWLKFVRTYDFSVSIRSGNNSYEGLSTANEIVIDLTFLTIDGEKQFEIHRNETDLEKSSVRVASGVRLGVLYAELANAGFSFAGGQCAPVCVGGLVGTGGIGFATRRYGWACDQLLSVECVLADGSIVTATADNEHAELFQACKGAGGAGLCVMTTLTVGIHPVVPMVWWSVFCELDKEDPLASGAKILKEWQRLANAPIQLSGAVFAATAKPTAGINAHGWYRVEDDHKHKDPDPEKTLCDILEQFWLSQLPGIEYDVFTALLPPEGEPLGNGTIEAATIGTLLVPMPFLNQWKLKAANTYRELSEEELGPIFKYLQDKPFADPTSGVGYFSPWLVGGDVMDNIDPNSAVVPVRKGAKMWLHYGAQWNDDTLGEEALKWVDGLAAVVENVSDGAWFGIPDLQLGSQLTYPPRLDYMKKYWSSQITKLDFVDFLVKVKNQYDPDDLFQFAQSIPLTMDPDLIV